MSLPIEHLATFAAVIDEGSFDAAARRLHVTPSAVSQRIRALEDRLGTVVIQRTRPVQPTAAGHTLLRAARQIERISGDVEAELGHDGRSAVIPIAVNADSLATWFLPAIVRANRATGALVELVRDDETRSSERLRTGEVIAALTSDATPVPGCTSTRIGVEQYVGVAHPGFAERYFPNGVTAEALRVAPMLEFDRHDMLERRFIRQITRAKIDPPRHLIPSSNGLQRAVELGLGWVVAPHAMAGPAIEEGRLTHLAPGVAVDVPLYWQHWNLSSPILDAVTAVVIDEAATALA